MMRVRGSLVVVAALLGAVLLVAFRVKNVVFPHDFCVDHRDNRGGGDIWRGWIVQDGICMHSSRRSTFLMTVEAGSRPAGEPTDIVIDFTNTGDWTDAGIAKVSTGTCVCLFVCLFSLA